MRKEGVKKKKKQRSLQRSAKTAFWSEHAEPPSPKLAPRDNGMQAPPHLRSTPFHPRRHRVCCVDAVQHQGTASLLQMTGSLTCLNNHSFGCSKKHKLLLHGLVTEQGGKGSKHRTNNNWSLRVLCCHWLRKPIPSVGQKHFALATPCGTSVSKEVQCQLLRCSKVYKISSGSIIHCKTITLPPRLLQPASVRAKNGVSHVATAQVLPPGAPQTTTRGVLHSQCEAVTVSTFQLCSALDNHARSAFIWSSRLLLTTLQSSLCTGALLLQKP